MIIGGLQKTSLIDYPGMISAVIFTQGCNFRCPYCHNPELVDPNRFHEVLPELEVLEFLERRKGLLDGVVITGGEPTIHNDLPDFLYKIKQLGYLIKLDTNGTNPNLLTQLLDDNLIDYIAMDIKAPLEKYYMAAGVNCDSHNLLSSLKILSESQKVVEFRTTAVNTIHDEEDIIEISKMIPFGRRFILQRFEPNKTLDSTYLNKAALPEKALNNLKERFQNKTFKYAVR
ncbi:MAG: anaerobic ribonucleoside-triphosphate reductase activating protein [Candidatus Cloacimonetes bacterium]|nr:anaerobic ribonucleoside-triphosphate reductase activating protein [Candidatus Cloacimonadota bacterium]